MKRALILLPALLAACHSKPAMVAENASASEVDAALVAKNGTGQFLSPGHWDVVATIKGMEAPGMPAGAVAKMKEQFGKPIASASCLTPEEAKQPAGKFFTQGVGDNCRYDHFAMSGGKIDSTMTCKGEGGAIQTMTLKGTYNPDAMHLDMTSAGKGGEDASSSATMALTVDGKRAGECTGKEEKS